jgi:hypothetical protein
VKTFDMIGRLAVAALAVCGSAGSVLLVPTGRSVAAQALALASHRAVYDLSLAQSQKASLQAVRGRILYDFTGNACEGYTTNVRQVSELHSSERPVSLSDLRSSTWEDDKGSSFQFTSSNYVNQELSTKVDGRAERKADGIEVILKQPVEKTFRLDSATVFPTDQLRRVIIAARAGKSLLELQVYDGSDNGEKVYNTLAVIGPAIPPTVKPSDVGAGQAALAGLTRWHVRVSYFEKGGTGEQTPVYAIAFELYENGLSRALKLDYNEFVIDGAMTSVEFRPTPACK